MLFTFFPLRFVECLGQLVEKVKRSVKLSMNNVREWLLNLLPKKKAAKKT